MRVLQPIQQAELKETLPPEEFAKIEAPCRDLCPLLRSRVVTATMYWSSWEAKLSRTTRAFQSVLPLG